MKIEDITRELHDELTRLKAESERLIREHEQLVAKFVRTHHQLDKINEKKHQSEIVRSCTRRSALACGDLPSRRVAD